MKPAGKTPYEIRLDLLQLAFDILSLKHAAVAANARKTGLDSTAYGPTTSPTTEDVITEAEKMNTFISRANTSHPY